MDEEENYWRRPNQFLPTLDYQIEELYSQFSRIILVLPIVSTY